MNCIHVTRSKKSPAATRPRRVGSVWGTASAGPRHVSNSGTAPAAGANSVPVASVGAYFVRAQVRLSSAPPPVQVIGNLA